MAHAAYLIKSQQKALAKLLEERLFEANKTYILGLKEYVNYQKTLLNLDQSTIDKLRNMLLNHHSNKLHQIR